MILHLVLLQFISILLSLHHNSILFKSSWTLVCISEIQLQHSACEKLLGIKIDSNLNWKNQIDQVCSKISSKIYLLSKIKKYLNLESSITLILNITLHTTVIFDNEHVAFYLTFADT
jgi:hypothetical protein